MLDPLPVGDPGEDQDGVQPALDAGHDVGVHPVADDGGVLGVDPQQVQAGAHHQGVGLAHIVGLLAGGQLDGGHQGPASGDLAPLRGGGEVGVGANEAGPVVHAPGRPADAVVGVVPGLPDDDVVGVGLIDGDAPLVEGVEQTGLPDDKGPGPGLLVGHKLRRGQGTGVEVLLVNVQPHPGEFCLELPLGLVYSFKVLSKELLVNVQPHPGEFCLELPLGLGAVVGEEEELLLLGIEPVHKLPDPREQTVAVVDDAVHVTDEPFLLEQCFHRDRPPVWAPWPAVFFVDVLLL